MIWPWELVRPHEYSVMLGRAHYGHALRLPHEEHALMFAPPRTGKSGLLADIMLRYPGRCCRPRPGPTSTRTPQRARRAPRPGRRVQSPGHRPGAQHAWRGIRSPAASTSPRPSGGPTRSRSPCRPQGVEDGAFWAAKTSDYLRAFFYAAAYRPEQGRALRAADGRAVGAGRRLAGGRGDPDRRRARIDWAAQVRELRGEAQKTAATVRMYMTRALGFLFDPALAQSVSPARRRPRARPGELRQASRHAVHDRLGPG